MWFSIAYSRQGALTGQSAQMRRAASTPTPALGKNVSGGSSLHLPRAIHTVSITPPAFRLLGDLVSSQLVHPPSYTGSAPYKPRLGGPLSLLSAGAAVGSPVDCRAASAEGAAQ